MAGGYPLSLRAERAYFLPEILVLTLEGVGGDAREGRFFGHFRTNRNSRARYSDDEPRHCTRIVIYALLFILPARVYEIFTQS